MPSKRKKIGERTEPDGSIYEVFSDGSTRLIAFRDGKGKMIYRDESWLEGVDVIGEKLDKLKWWQEFDREKSEQARLSWNRFMPNGTLDYSLPFSFQNLSNISPNSNTPKALQTSALGGNEPWQKQVFKPLPIQAYDGPDYNRNIRISEDLRLQEENEINGIFKEDYRWNADSRSINYLTGRGWENEVNKFSSERQGYTFLNSSFKCNTM